MCKELASDLAKTLAIRARNDKANKMWPHCLSRDVLPPQTISEGCRSHRITPLTAAQLDASADGLNRTAGSISFLGHVSEQ